MTTHLPPLSLGNVARGTPGVKTLKPPRRRRRSSDGIDVVDTRPKQERGSTRSSAGSRKVARPARSDSEKLQGAVKKLKATVKKLTGTKTQGRPARRPAVR